MILLLLLLPTAIALDTNIPCDLPVYNNMPEKWENKAFILKNTVPLEFRKEVELDTLYQKYGDYEIGIDHPGSGKPPSKHWQKTTMAQYIDNHVGIHRPHVLARFGLCSGQMWWQNYV